MTVYVNYIPNRDELINYLTIELILTSGQSHSLYEVINTICLSRIDDKAVKMYLW